jgi:hypothetical protein
MKEELQVLESQVDRAVQGLDWDSQDQDLSKMLEVEPEIMQQDLEAGQVD